MEKPEYWTCYIGPIDGKELDRTHPNGEGRLRAYVEQAFYEVAGHHADRCGSGWGHTADQLDAISFHGNSEEYKAAIVRSYIKEGKKMSRYVRAWYLLMLEEETLFVKDKKK